MIQRRMVALISLKAKRAKYITHANTATSARAQSDVEKMVHSERLLDRYREGGGWERLAADKRLWLAAGAGLSEHSAGSCRR